MGDVQEQISACLRDFEFFVETMHSGLTRLTDSLGHETEKTIAHPKIASSKKILVIDPAEINRVLFTRYFQGLPLEISFARSDEEAENKIAQQRYDLVLRDWKIVLSQGLSKQAVVESVLKQLQN